MESASDGHYNRKFRAVRGIQIEEEVVRMVKIGIAVGPGIVVDATEAGQKEKGGAIVRRGVVNLHAAMLGVHGNRLKPLRQTFPHVFLKKSLSLDSVRVAAQNQSPVAQKGQDEISHAVVVGQ